MHVRHFRESQPLVVDSLSPLEPESSLCFISLWLDPLLFWQRSQWLSYFIPPLRQYGDKRKGPNPERHVTFNDTRATNILVRIDIDCYRYPDKKTDQNIIKEISMTTLTTSSSGLTTITTNILYPAYKTKKGTTIQLNGLKTVLPDGETLKALITFADESGLKSVLITGGSEASGHSKASFHGKNLAIDVAGKKFNTLSDTDAINAAKKAGFTHGVYEDFRGTGKDHWHFQIGAGNGMGEKQSLENSSMFKKSY